MKYLLIILALAWSSSAAIAETFTVTNTNNSGPGSLYEAINAGSNSPGGAVINFNIPGSGVHVIDVGANPLPKVKNVIIDGYSQPGAHPNTLALGDDAVILIQIDGGGVAGRYGFWVLGFSQIRGLAITRCDTAIAALDPFDGNLFDGNFIGIEAAAHSAAPNRVGIFVSTGATIGGTTAAARNVISGNTIGVGLGSRNPTTVAGNYIGTGLSGAVALPNSIGIDVQSALNAGIVIGGDHASGNVISSNSYGVRLGYPFRAPDGHPVSNPGNYVTVSGNLIGTTADGQGRLGNRYQGIAIFDGVDNTIGGSDPASGNTIAFNGAQGISVENFAGSASGNRILSNSIYANGICNIDLDADGPTPNDPMDTDDGPNHRQNFPVITSTYFSTKGTAIDGYLNSTPNTEFRIEFFGESQDYLDPSQSFLGSTIVTTDNNGNAPFFASVPTPAGYVNATATDPAGNTSEFFLRESRFRNLSTRGRVEPGDNALIGGITASGLPKAGSKIIVRAIGPSLAANGSPLAGRLEDPTLEIYGRNGLIGSNDNWRDDPNTAADLQKYGLAPANDLEAAGEIDPGIGGQFTVVVRGKNNSGGIGVVEFYDVTGTRMHLVNVSTRGLVQSGDNVMIGGFIAADGNGQTPFVLRALGPSLSNFGIQNSLPDPVLELHDSNGETLAINDNWQEDPLQEDNVNAAGLAPSDPKESAMLMMLPPGAYTAIVRGNDGGTGVALVEVYQLP
ncbi:MAG TPA: hypothetical protein VJU77_05200 [Chthoniobacterales bacterium]|nr:hypothetical protein [Chthoniobacterales bacterium]